MRADLLPKIEGSAIGASIVPLDPAAFDVKFAVELGAMIMLDKPIILLVQPGTVLPDALVRVAVEIVEFDRDDLEGSSTRMRDAMDRVLNGT